MKATVTILTGPQAGQTLWLNDGQETTLGRTERADRAFPDDPQMSGLHAVLRWSGPTLQIVDLQSSNGTVVNGQKVGTAVLADGDQFALGQTRFSVRLSGTSQLGATPPLSHPPVVARPTAPAADAQPASRVSPPMALSRPSVAGGELRATENLRSWLDRRVGVAGRAYVAAWFDPDPQVQFLASRAAAWSRQPWLLDFCRQSALRPAGAPWAGLELLGILGGPQDLRSVLQLGRLADLGARRYVVLGAFGHAAVVPELLVGITDHDAVVAVAAGWAFQEITGFDPFTGPLIEVPASGIGRPNWDDPEEVLQIGAPEGRAAGAWWSEHRTAFGGAERWARGRAVDAPAGSDLLAALDLPALERICLREHYLGIRAWSPFRFRRFPLDGRPPTRRATQPTRSASPSSD